MKYTAFIKNVETGEIRECTDEYPDEYLDSLQFVWSEGNFACDCNRRAIFEGHDTHAIELPCGDVSFMVSHLTLENGTRIEIQS